MTVQLCYAIRRQIKVTDAAMLMADYIPNDSESRQKLNSIYEDKVRISAARDLILDAIRSKNIKGYLFKSRAEPNEQIEISVTEIKEQFEDPLERNVDKIYVNTYELKEWILSRPFPEAFFSRYQREIDIEHSIQLEMLKEEAIKKDLPGNDTDVPISNTMQAAIDVVKHLRSDPKALSGKTPKNAVIKWLTENYAAYGLINKVGEISNTTINDIASLVNWRKEGGAPKT